MLYLQIHSASISPLTSVFSSFAFTASSSAIAYAGIKSNVKIILSIFKALIPYMVILQQTTLKANRSMYEK